jgi:hypothetical protein
MRTHAGLSAYEEEDTCAHMLVRECAHVLLMGCSCVANVLPMCC